VSATAGVGRAAAASTLARSPATTTSRHRRGRFGLVEPAIIHVADAFDAMTSTGLPASAQQETVREARPARAQFNARREAFIAAIERRNEC
jgi:hypothetical protein